MGTAPSAGLCQQQGLSPSQLFCSSSRCVQLKTREHPHIGAVQFEEPDSNRTMSTVSKPAAGSDVGLQKESCDTLCASLLHLLCQLCLLQQWNRSCATSAHVKATQHRLPPAYGGTALSLVLLF